MGNLVNHAAVDKFDKVFDLILIRIYPKFHWYAGTDERNRWNVSYYNISRSNGFVFLYSIQLDLDEESKKKDILLGFLRVNSM